MQLGFVRPGDLEGAFIIVTNGEGKPLLARVDSIDMSRPKAVMHLFYPIAGEHRSELVNDVAPRIKGMLHETGVNKIMFARIGGRVPEWIGQAV